MKFSIIVPVYNVEQYLSKCLDSIKNQTYTNFEVIIVNDGSTDNSEKIINKYLKDTRFKKYNKSNGGLSDARNYGIQFVSGEYILFIDSDDWIDNRILQKLEEIIKIKDYDLVKFNIIDVIDNREYKHKEKLTLSKEVSIKDLIWFDYFEPAVSYCYKTKFYTDNRFQFEQGKYHEDFGLIPIILAQAKSIYYLNYFGYYYVKRDNSIVNDKNKIAKRAEDTLYFFKKNSKMISNIKNIDKSTKEELISFYANGAIRKLSLLSDKKEYRKKLKKEKVYKYLSSNTIKRKIKKFICKISIDLYLKFF